MTPDDLATRCPLVVPYDKYTYRLTAKYIRSQRRADWGHVAALLRAYLATV